MAYYLIDFENLKNINGCDTLLENDTIVFFYSKNANTLSFELHSSITSPNNSASAIAFVDQVPESIYAAFVFKKLYGTIANCKLAPPPINITL